MEKNIVVTEDGSHTISVPALQATYHSTHGAIQESMHVYIEAGLRFYITRSGGNNSINIFEMGFGTGLNALLTLIEAEKCGTNIYYDCLETHPLEKEIMNQLNYCEQLQRPDMIEKFNHIHNHQWGKPEAITDNFCLCKQPISLLHYSANQKFNIIFFDAFAPTVQPELWTESVLLTLNKMLETDGILVTYCSKVAVRKAMEAAGFFVEKIPGPRGKREMVRAYKK